MTQLCNELRAEDKTCKSQTAHHLDTITFTQKLLPEQEDTDDEICDDDAECELDLKFNQPDSGYSTLDQDLIDLFTHQADDIDNQSHSLESSFSSPLAIPSSTPSLVSAPVTAMSLEQSHSILSKSVPNNRAPFLPPQLPRRQSAQPSIPEFAVSKAFTAPSTRPSSQTSKYRCHCGYEPTGSEEWKASNFARHKRTQHSSAAKVYRCRFPSCTAKYKRSDNLRAHLRLKGHGVIELLFEDSGDGAGYLEGKEEGQEAAITSHPSKRRKRGDGGDMGLQ